MGIFCEINLFKPPNGTFSAGGTVSGLIKSAVDKPTNFKKITISLKGGGRLVIRQKQARGRGRSRTNRLPKEYVYTNGEVYVDIDKIIHPLDKTGTDSEVLLLNDSFEIPFSFTLPHNIPPSLTYSTHTGNTSIYCNITYYIRIKFERPGLIKFDKRFKQEIIVESNIIPRLPIVPTIFGEQKTLTQIFSSKKSIVNIKANIETCVIKPGDKIYLNYEVINDTNVTIKGVETKLVEVYNFATHGKKVQITERVVGTDSKTGIVKSGTTQTMAVDIIVPSEKISLDHSKIVSRDYEISIKAILPLPHRNAVLKIPVQIGLENADREVVIIEDPPPSYWQVMAEEVEKNEAEDINIKIPQK